MKCKKKQSQTEVDKSLDLSQLVDSYSKGHGAEVRENIARMRAEQDEYEKKYGEGWYAIWLEHVDPIPDYDMDSKVINQVLYDGDRLCVSGTGPHAKYMRERFVQQAREVYGDAFDRLERHKRGDSEAVELLLKWAERTGKWKELPDCLQPVYHKRIGV